MNKNSIRKFVDWLESASVDEIREHQQFIAESMKDVRTRDGRADLRLALRLIDEELVARGDLLKAMG